MTEVIIDVEWEEIPNTPKIKESKSKPKSQQKKSKVDTVIFALFYSEITFIVTRFLYECYMNYVFWSGHGGVTLHSVVFGMP